MEFRKWFPKGTLVFSEGDVGSCAYIVEEGCVEISVGGEHVHVATRRAGEVFGEMAIIDDKPRSASARAVDDCTLLMITREQLAQRIAVADPILRLCIGVLLENVRHTTRRLTRPADPTERTQQVGDAARQEALAAIRLEQEIENAIDLGQFELWYQPMVELRTGRIGGFEALIRWRHPERGLIPPGRFIPAAERSGLIVPMTRWAFRRACEDLLRFGEELSMSVNFSIRDFATPDFLQEVDLALGEIGVRPDHVKFEITESLLMDSPDTAKRLLGDLRQRGAKVAIDDFGTGYSSLRYLSSLPIDSLKIDQSFVRGMFIDDSNRSLVHSIVNLARDLGMSTTAEGIEEVVQASALRELGVELGQGFLFSRPQPADKIEGFLAAWRPPAYLGGA